MGFSNKSIVWASDGGQWLYRKNRQIIEEKLIPITHM